MYAFAIINQENHLFWCHDKLHLRIVLAVISLPIFLPRSWFAMSPHVVCYNFGTWRSYISVIVSVRLFHAACTSFLLPRSSTNRLEPAQTNRVFYARYSLTYRAHLKGNILMHLHCIVHKRVWLTIVCTYVRIVPCCHFSTSVVDLPLDARFALPGFCIPKEHKRHISVVSCCLVIIVWMISDLTIIYLDLLHHSHAGRRF